MEFSFSRFVRRHSKHFQLLRTYDQEIGSPDEALATIVCLSFQKQRSSRASKKRWSTVRCYLYLPQQPQSRVKVIRRSSLLAWIPQRLLDAVAVISFGSLLDLPRSHGEHEGARSLKFLSSVYLRDLRGSVVN